jgi:Tfp pilus assembly PilM family ATPase
VDGLKEVRARTKTDYVRLSLPEERAYLFETTVKRGTPFKEIHGLLEFKLEENVPLSPRDAFFDYDIVENDPEGQVLRIIVAVYAKDTIINYYEACRKANLIPLSFEIEAQAIARTTVGKNLNDTSMVVDFGKTRLGVGIVHEGSLMYTSTIDIGGTTLSTAMRKVLGEVSEDDLTEIKNTRGLLEFGENKAIVAVLQDIMRTLREELQTRIHYWHTRDIERGEREIKRIILCGGSSNLRGLPEYLSKEFSLPVETADVWQNAFSIDRFVPPITKRYSYGYTTAVGLALTDFIENGL